MKRPTTRASIESRFAKVNGGACTISPPVKASR